MKLALVYPQYSHKIFNENLPTVDNEFGVFPYISFGHVANEAKRAGWDVKLFDLAASKQPYREFLEDIKSYNPDLIGYAAHAVQTFRDLHVFAKRLKVDLPITTVVGGYEAKRYPLEIIEHDCFDYLCSGGAETFFVPFLNYIATKSDLSNVPDLYYKRDGEVLYTFKGETTCFKDLAPPDRSIFPNELYRSHVSQRKNFTIGLSSDGCPYNCNFCCMENSSFNARSAQQVYDEMKECADRYKIKEIDWFDPVMFHNKQRILELLKLLEEHPLDIIWSARARIDSLTLKKSGDLRPDVEFIQKLSKGGCRRIFVGIESADEEILSEMSKGTTLLPIKDVVQCATDNGIGVLGFFMIGSQGETVETVRKTVEFSKTLPLDYAQFSMTIMKPHTTLYNSYKETILGHDYWRDYIRGEADEMILPRPWTKLSSDEIIRLTQKAYLSFYFRPKYIFKMLRKIESLSELIRYIKVAIQLFARAIHLPSPKLRPLVLYAIGVLASLLTILKFVFLGQ